VDAVSISDAPCGVKNRVFSGSSAWAVPVVAFATFGVLTP
jgi:hypothetical protein